MNSVICGLWEKNLLRMISIILSYLKDNQSDLYHWGVLQVVSTILVQNVVYVVLILHWKGYSKNSFTLWFIAKNLFRYILMMLHYLKHMYLWDALYHLHGFYIIWGLHFFHLHGYTKYFGYSKVCVRIYFWIAFSVVEFFF